MYRITHRHYSLATAIGFGLLIGANHMAYADELGVGESAIGKVHAGAQLGVVLPQLQSELGTSVGFSIEAGYQAWKQLSPFVSLAYTQPKTSSELNDQRLTGNGYTTATTQRELTVTVGAFWRVEKVIPRLNVYGGLGARIWMLETLSDGESAGAVFEENRETSTRFGAAALGGGEYLLGPGAAVLQLDVGGSDLPHAITGDVATTAISVSAGYRFLFL